MMMKIQVGSLFGWRCAASHMPVWAIYLQSGDRLQWKNICVTDKIRREYIRHSRSLAYTILGAQRQASANLSLSIWRDCGHTHVDR